MLSAAGPGGRTGGRTGGSIGWWTNGKAADGGGQLICGLRWSSIGEPNGGFSSSWFSSFAESIID